MQFKNLNTGEKFRFQFEPKKVCYMKIEVICLSAKTKHKPNYVVLAGREDVGTASDAHPDVGVELVE